MTSAPETSVSTSTGAARRGRSTSSRRSRTAVLLLVSPALLLSLVFIGYPVASTVWLSFQQWPGLGRATPVGLDNFFALAQDPKVVQALGNNLLFAVVVTLCTVALGTVLALPIDRRVRFWKFYRFVYFLPYIVPITVIAIMWSNAFDPHFGWATKLFGFVPQAATGLLADPNSAIWVVCWVAIWHLAGFPMVYMIGALGGIPQEIKEAALLDGANAIQTAARVTLPLCRDTLATIVLLQVIFSFKVFDLVQALTRGGPGTSTQVLGTLIYREAFINSRFGYASALAVVATLIIVTVSLGYLSIFRPHSIDRHG